MRSDSYLQRLFETETSTVYHGTTKAFEAFDVAYTSGDIGVHFGDREQAEHRVWGHENARIIAARLHLKNPLRLEDEGGWYGESFVRALNGVLGTRLSPSAGTTTIRRAIQAAGYDSVVYANRFEGEGGSDSYIVFDPFSQVTILGSEPLE